MKNIFKIAITAIAMLTISFTANAQQKGEMAAGANVVFGVGDGYSNLGIGAKFQWNVINRLRLEPSFTYFFKKDYLSMWDLSANVHYLFSMGDKVTLYPLAGLSVLGVSAGVAGYSVSDTEIGFNIGGGVDFKLSKTVVLNAEAKYKVGGNWNRFLPSVGVSFKF